MGSSYCLCVCMCVYMYIPSVNLWMPEQVSVKIDMRFIAFEPISLAYFLNPAHQSLCRC
jgi:hypothetical protein